MGRVGALVHLLLGLGLIFFAICPSDEQRSMPLLNGAFLGLVVFGIFDGTNYCLFGPTVYPMGFVLKDVAWGTFNCAVSSVAGAHFLQES